MPFTPKWSADRQAVERAAADARRQARRAEREAVEAAEAEEVERIRQMMEAEFGAGIQFIACRRGKPPVFGRPK